MIPAALMVLSALVAAPADDDLKTLQGTWQPVEVERRGKKAGKDSPEAKDMRLVFTGDSITLLNLSAPGKERKKKFTIQPAKSPKELDMVSLDGQEAGEKAQCIYKIEKDRLTICLPDDPKKRPKEFKAGQDDGTLLITLERTKAE